MVTPRRLQVRLLRVCGMLEKDGVPVSHERILECDWNEKTTLTNGFWNVIGMKKQQSVPQKE